MQTIKQMLYCLLKWKYKRGTPKLAFNKLRKCINELTKEDIRREINKTWIKY